MKRHIIFFLVLFMAVNAYSQLSWGPRVGVNFSKYAYNWDSEIAYAEPEVKSRFGQSAGLMINLNLGKYILFQPAAQFTVKGVSYNVDSWNSGDVVNKGHQRTRVYYLEIPANFAIGINLGGGNLQLFAGPYIGFALSGRLVYDYTVEDGTSPPEPFSGSDKIEFTGTVTESEFEKGFNDIAVYDQRNLDYGFDVGLGYKIKNLLINAGFAMGLANLQPDISGDKYDATDYKYANRTIFVTAAWLFGEEKK